jgi:hypothetical protein
MLAAAMPEGQFLVAAANSFLATNPEGIFRLYADGACQREVPFP